jgi:hypothetical protein
VLRVLVELRGGIGAYDSTLPTLIRGRQRTMSGECGLAVRRCSVLARRLLGTQRQRSEGGSKRTVGPKGAPRRGLLLEGQADVTEHERA